MGISVGRIERKGIAILIVIALLLSSVTGIAAAQSVSGASGTIVIEEGETVSNIDALAGTIVVRGTVTGDISGAAGSIHIAEGGQVEGSLSGAAGDVHIEGVVGGDVRAGSGNVRITESAIIGGDVDVGAAYVRINGRIDGDVRVGAETLDVGPNADVRGELRYDADKFTLDSGATVGGGVVEDPNLRGAMSPFGVPNWFTRGYVILANLVLGAILLVLFPAFSAGVAERVSEDPLKTGGVGLLALLGVPVILVLSAITIVGIPFAVIGAIAYGVAIWTGIVYGEYAVAAWLLRQADRDDHWVALIAGIVGFGVLRVVPILGGVLEFAALLFGLGALALGLRDAFRKNRRSGPKDRQTTFDESFTESSAGAS